jgi:hypothetical protein
MPLTETLEKKRAEKLEKIHFTGYAHSLSEHFTKVTDHILALT